MALIQKFTVVDPSVRSSYSLKTSTHKLLKLYDLFYKDQYKEEATAGELVENILLYVLRSDADFQKFTKRLNPAQQTELDETMAKLGATAPVLTPALQRPFVSA
jgi:hypothetical protein